jgi:ParB-like chromosome segregation protein Spo0J
MALRIEYLPVEALRPYERNARTHSDAQIDAIAESIRQFGFNSPILIDDADGVIAGHARLAAARKLELDTVPCVRLSHLNDAQRRAYILADNRLAEMAVWDVPLLSLEVDDLKLEDVDLSFLDLDSLLAAEGENEDFHAGDVDEQDALDTKAKRPKAAETKPAPITYPLLINLPRAAYEKLKLLRKRLGGTWSDVLAKLIEDYQ